MTLENIKIASPCSADWNAMSGDERTRFCAECGKHVYNVSAMTRREASALVAKTEGRLCVRFYRRADGTVLTQDCPVGLRARAARVRRRLSWAVSGLLGFAGVASAQSVVTGTTTSGALVSLVDQESGVTITTVADDRGAFRFVGLTPGQFDLEIEIAGTRMVSRSVTVGSERHVELVLTPIPLTEVVTVGQVELVGRKHNWFRRIFR
jgi:hypothetical protein